ncbi:hypothetical protein [Cellulomonas sp. NPDC058312]|uniref:hypothetical protein n=1 Tax=Cellulomonas sp. NPDC058312 TaxID=3346441 RepID=UPI0036E7F69C
MDWQLPDPLPWPAGACADEALRVPVDLGLPEGGSIKVRWRTPSHANPRSRKTPTSDLQTVALAADVARAVRAGGNGWEPDVNGWPVHVRPDPTALAPASLARVIPLPRLVDEVPTQAMPTQVEALAGDRVVVGPHNATLAEVRAGRRELGATVAQVIAAIRREREPGWSPAHRVNMANVLDFVEQVLVYAEPVVDDVDADLPEVAAWMRARLELPGVEVGGSVHVALLLTPDLTRAIEVRRSTDRRLELLNEQRMAKWEAARGRWEAAVAQQAAGVRRGRMPTKPDDPLLRDVTVVVCSPRTEELFANALGMVLGFAEQHGLLAGPNPWRRFSAVGSSLTGYRRSELVRPHQRNVPPVGTVVDLADAIAELGPVDPRTGRPTGDRFRALVLASLLGPRPSEMDALAADDFRPGPDPTLHVAKSAASVHRLASEDGTSISVRDGLKHRPLGSARVVGMPQVVADALEEHIALEYASDRHLFTSPEGGVLRWGNQIVPYWRPAVERVLGRSSSDLLRDMPRKWLRKAAVTWMLRSGLSVEHVAELTGHDVVTLYRHYSGVVGDLRSRQVWSGWDDAWAWAVREHGVN